MLLWRVLIFSFLCLCISEAHAQDWQQYKNFKELGSLCETLKASGKDLDFLRKDSDGLCSLYKGYSGGVFAGMIALNSAKSQKLFCVKAGDTIGVLQQEFFAYWDGKVSNNSSFNSAEVPKAVGAFLLDRRACR